MPLEWREIATASTRKNDSKGRAIPAIPQLPHIKFLANRVTVKAMEANIILLKPHKVKVQITPCNNRRSVKAPIIQHISIGSQSSQYKHLLYRMKLILLNRMNTRRIQISKLLHNNQHIQHHNRHSQQNRGPLHHQMLRRQL
jgi:hypothetical protein